MSSREPSENPFEVLDVPLDTDDRAVRQAYARRIRQARAGGDADESQSIQHAFEAIRDKESRDRLRKLYEGANKVEPLLEEAGEAVAAKDFPKANGLFHRLLQEAPDSEPAVLAYHQYQCFRGRYDRAFKAARKLVQLAPSNAAYYRLSAETLWYLAEATDRKETFDEQARLALKYLRRAKDLGDDSTAVIIFESRILWAQTRRQLATRILRERLHASTEIRTEELNVAIALLRFHGTMGGGPIFRETLEAIATRLPDVDERRRTIGIALCRLGVEFAESSLPRAIDCAELAEICCPSDPRISRFASQLLSVQERNTADIEEGLADNKITLPIPEAGKHGGSRWRSVVLVALLVHLSVFGVKTCDRFDSGEKIEIHDHRGRAIGEIDSKDTRMLEELMRDLERRSTSKDRGPVRIPD